MFLEALAVNCILNHFGMKKTDVLLKKKLNEFKAINE